MIPDNIMYKTAWMIRKFADDAAFVADMPYDVSAFEGNLLLNEGIGEALDLLAGTGSPTAYSNANAYLGVGDSNTAASASQTALQAATNKTYKAMASTYPSRASQTTTWRAVFASGDANYSWQEFTIINASSDTGKNLNRKVSDQGTKASGQTWTLDMTLVLS
jgi:hypothetical protein